MYKVYEKGVCLGSFDNTQIEELFGIKKSGIRNYAVDGRLAKGKYMLVFDEEADDKPLTYDKKTLALLKEWDRVRLCILKGVRP